jgi:DNA-binding Lrp family transcriptional regulator
MRPLDRIDFDILDALQNDARLSNKELAARIGLAPSSCLERVRNLQQSGVLRGFHADVDPRAVGIELEAMIAIRLKQHSRESLAAIREHLAAQPEVIQVFRTSGENDFLVHVAVPNVQYLRDMTIDRIASRAELSHMETAIIFDFDRSWVRPSFVDPA